MVVSIVILAGVLVGILGLSLYLFYRVDKRLDKGEVRRAIAISLTATYIILLVLSLIPNNTTTALNFGDNNPFVEHFFQVFLVVMAFYFGARAIETGLSARNKGKIKDLAKEIFDIDTTEKETSKIKEELKQKIESAENPEDLKKWIKKLIDRV